MISIVDSPQTSKNVGMGVKFSANVAKSDLPDLLGEGDDLGHIVFHHGVLSCIVIVELD